MKEVKEIKKVRMTMFIKDSGVAGLHPVRCILAGVDIKKVFVLERDENVSLIVFEPVFKEEADKDGLYGL